MLAPGSNVGAGMAGLQPIEVMAPVQTKLYRHY